VRAETNDPYVNRALHYIETSLHTVRSIHEICLRLGISRTGFHVRFTGEIGEPPGRFLRRYRAAWVRRLLQETPGMSLKHAAALAGYGSAEAMSRAVRREFGTTPGALRRKGRR